MAVASHCGRRVCSRMARSRRCDFLLDVPSLVLIALAVAAVEKGRPLLSAFVMGISPDLVGKPTSWLLRRSRFRVTSGGTGWRLVLAGVLTVLPLVVWLDYLRSIYRSTIFVQVRTSCRHQARPSTFSGDLSWSAISPLHPVGLFSMKGLWLCLLIPLAVQALLSPRPCVATRCRGGVGGGRVCGADAAHGMHADRTEHRRPDARAAAVDRRLQYPACQRSTVDTILAVVRDRQSSPSWRRHRDASNSVVVRKGTLNSLRKRTLARKVECPLYEQARFAAGDARISMGIR